MNEERAAARKARKLRASRDQWKRRSDEKQKQIRQLRVSNRDLLVSRERWKQRAKELEEQLKTLQAAHQADSTAGSDRRAFLGGLMLQTVPKVLSLDSG